MERISLIVYDVSEAQRCVPNYPKRLDALGSSAPKTVYWRGESWSPEPRAVALIGARRASEAGRRWACELSKELASAGIAVVSGGALGIDAQAHRGALLGNGRTCVVLPGPVDEPTPSSHRPLFDDVVSAGGTLLSEYKKRPPGRFAYATRNRLIAALSDIVVVVEAGINSGTRYTIEAALHLRRPVLCKAWLHCDERATTARSFEARGISWVERIDEVLRAFDTQVVSLRPRNCGIDSKTMEDPLWIALAQPGTVEELEARLSVEPGALGLQLLQGELEGRYEQISGRWQRMGR